MDIRVWLRPVLVLLQTKTNHQGTHSNQKPHSDTHTDSHQLLYSVMVQLYGIGIREGYPNNHNSPNSGGGASNGASNGGSNGGSSGDSDLQVIQQLYTKLWKAKMQVLLPTDKVHVLHIYTVYTYIYVYIANNKSRVVVIAVV